MSVTKERPILFSAPMVRAILEGRKTVTRRALNAQALKNIGYGVQFGECHELPTEGPLHPNSIDYYNGFSPFGRPGERLWVRETWPPDPDSDHDAWYEHHETYEAWAGCGARIDGVPLALCNSGHCIYRADGELSDLVWRPSIHMPRWASRILLEITDVRVEQLQDITYEDAVAEGVHRDRGCRMWTATDEGDACHKYPIPAFRDLWTGINGADSWNANPWVWVVKFKQVTP